MESIRTSGHTSCPFESTNAWPDSAFAAGFSAILAGSAQAFPRNSGHSRVPTEFRVGDFLWKNVPRYFFEFFCFMFCYFFRPPGRSPADRIFCEKVVFLDTLAPADVPRQIPGRSPGRYKKNKQKKQKHQTKKSNNYFGATKNQKIFWHNEKSNNHSGKTKQAYQFCRAKSLE